MDKTSKVPLYFQLMEELIKKIENQIYNEHEQLPSERELCTIYDLSRITVRQALQDLEREGYIYKLKGKGTFVAPKSYDQHLSTLYSFTDEMAKLGKTPSSKVLKFRIITVDERLAQKMEIEALEDVYEVVRLRYADDEPLMYETSYLPCKIFPNLTAEQMIEKPMYDIFQKDYQIGLTKATERFTATLIRDDEAVHLNVKAGQPAMLIKRFSYFNNQLIEYTSSIARGDKFAYTVELT
ncbi:GntR family transcriptional regulator [Sporosarcina sp.]|uniref:GntR family transcriptional regulator n=1 Tax=Sporosarcina sp. TaxID=49982 RepID=UPI002627D839|nr:GntR family transcriptional regulator [Sporosarcina sp.]